MILDYQQILYLNVQKEIIRIIVSSYFYIYKFITELAVYGTVNKKKTNARQERKGGRRQGLPVQSGATRAEKETIPLSLGGEKR
jgi:hypothetical protein